MRNRELADELARLAADDQRVRKDWRKPDFEARMEMARVDTANTARIEEIIDEHGWPGKSLVGERGARNAWLLVQHAGHRIDLMRRVVDLPRDAVAVGDAEAKHLAYLDDRVRMMEGRPQLYGTQFHSRGGGPVEPWPIEDEEYVDERRAEVGLGPFAENAARFTR